MNTCKDCDYRQDDYCIHRKSVYNDSARVEIRNNKFPCSVWKVKILSPLPMVCDTCDFMSGITRDFKCIRTDDKVINKDDTCVNWKRDTIPDGYSDPKTTTPKEPDNSEPINRTLLEEVSKLFK